MATFILIFMKKNLLIILLLALFKFILPFLLSHPDFELHRDEFLYYQQGQHLDFGYLENPPFIGLLGNLASLFGGSFFWVKFWPSFFGACTVLITAGIAKELGGKLFAQVMACLGILFTAYLRIHFLFQPNFLDIFFWSLSIYFLLRFINTSNIHFLYFLATALALGFWSKYSMLFFMTALVISIVLTQHRTIMQLKHFWLAATIGLLLMVPNVLWQWFHHWPLVHHMHELQDTQLKYLNKADFIKDQLLMLLPFSFVWISGLVWLLFHHQYRILGWIYLLVITLLMMGSGKGYYALGIYPMLLAAGSTWFESITIRKIWFRYAFVLFTLVLALPFVPLLMPMQSPHEMQLFNQRYHVGKFGLLKWEDRKDHLLQQDFADMLGWKELSNKTETFFTSLPDSIKRDVIIYCNNYGQAGALKYFGSHDNFKSRVISDNGTFLFWIPGRLWFRHVIYIGEQMPGKNEAVFQHFQQIQSIDSINNPLSREYRTKIIFFQHASDSAWIIAAKNLRLRKAEFGE